MKMRKIRVVQFGLGAMGSVMARMVLEKKDLELVGAIVRSDEDNGRDVADLVGLKKKTGVIALNKPEKVLKSIDADVMLHAAVSYVPKVWEQIKPAVKAGVNVVTIAEEMGYPFVKYPKLCKEMDAVARRKDVSILGSGINPGFAMDVMPVMLSGICEQVKSVKVTRVIDFSPFGPSIQKNIGISLGVEEFKAGVRSGKLPLHIGLPESAHMLAAGLGWKLEKVVETRDPVVARKRIRVPKYKTIVPGQVAGFDHRCFGMRGGKVVITLEELGRVDPKVEYKNTIYLKGKPDLVESVNVPLGNVTTTSHAVNLTPVVVAARPGLLSMLDLPPAPVLADR